MKKCHFFITVSLVLLLFSGAAWASEDTPAILAALDGAGVTVLDDAAIADIRGQDGPLYVMVKILGINTWDFSRNPNIDWTLNPFGFRYGNWGGLFYTANGNPVDEMDTLFRDHDNEAITDGQLLTALIGLPSSLYGGYDNIWGYIYQATDLIGDGHDKYMVGVSRVSWMSAGGKFFFGWRAMPLPEYARRQAVIGMGIVTALP